MMWPPQRSFLLQSACVACVVLVFAVAAAAAAPFGMTRGAAPPEIGGFAAWILAEQAKFYLMLSHAIRAAKADGSAAFTLMGISFAYGIFHAAGPGHGKAVISSYILANNETWRRGVMLSFAAAVLQSITAITIVGVAAVLLGATAKTMGDTVNIVETVSYALIMSIGLRLLWVKGRAFLRLVRAETTISAALSPSYAYAHGRPAAQAHCEAHPPAEAEARQHGHHHGRAHAHSHEDAHHDHEDDASAWGHAHAPEPRELGGVHWLRRGLSAVVAVGMRPCSGAIIVLVFALAQGLFWIGVASTFVMGLGTAITVTTVATIAVAGRRFAGRLAKAKPGAGMIVLRGLEMAAAAVIVLLGTALLTGYMVSERLIGV